MSRYPPHDPRHAFRDDLATFPTTELATRRRAVPLFVLVGGGLVVLVCLGLGIFFAIRSQTGHARVAVAPQQSLDAKIAESVAAFSGDPDGLERTVPAEIMALLNRVTAATRREDHAAFRALVDRDRLFARVRDAAPIDGADVFQQIAWKREIHESLEADPNWYRCQVARVVPVAAVPNNVVVYARCRSVHDDPVEFRWWLAKVDAQWRIYDWERLDLALTQSRQWALYLQYQDDDRLSEYYDGNRHMIDAENLIEKGDDEGAKALLRLASQRNVPPALDDFRLVLLGYDWRSAGESREAIECFQRVGHPRATPGAYYGQAVCYQDLGLQRRALEFITLYENTVGPVADVGRLKADALAALGREAEAVSVWRKILAVEPDDRESLRSWWLARQDAERDALIRAIERTSDPVAAAVDLAWSSSGEGDEQGLRILRTFVKQAAPDSPHVAGVSGMLLSVERDDERAAEFFQQALSQAADDPTRSTYLYCYLDAMTNAGKLLDAYHTAPHPDDTFLYFAGCWEDGETDLTDEPFRQLVTAHRQRRPGDPWGDYYAALLAPQKPQAEQALRDGLKKVDGDGDAAAPLRTELASVLFEQHRVLEAYRTIPPAGERFSQLASLCRWEQRQEELWELIAEHRLAYPDYPWIAFHEAWLLESDGKLDEAIDLYQQCRQQIDEDNYAVRSALMSAYVKAGRWEEAYRDSDSPEVAFDDLAGLLMEADNPSAADALLEVHAAECPDDPALAFRTTEWCWEQHDYQRLVDTLASQPASSFASLFPWQRSAMWLRAARSHLRLGQEAEAMALAKRIFDEQELLEPLLLVHAAAGDPVQVRRWLEDYANTNRWYSWIYRDEDIGRILATDQFRSLREDYPTNLPYSVGDTVAVFLLDEPIDLPTEALSARLTELLGADANVFAPKSATGEPRFVVRTDGTAIWGVAHQGQFCGDQNWWDGIKSDTLQQRVGRHHAWLAIGYANWLDGDEPDTRFVMQVGNRLAGDDVLAVYLEEDARILDGDEAGQWVVAGEEPPARVGELGETIPSLYPAEAEPTEGGVQFEFPRRLFAAARSFQDGDRPQLEVCFRLRSGLFREPLWLRVARVKKEGRTYTFTGPLQTSSRLLPTWSAGEYVALQEYEVLAFKYQAGDTTVLTERWPGAANRFANE